MPPGDPAHYVRGQHEGYRDIDGVAADSTTRRTPRCGSTSTAGGGRACPSSPHGQVPAGHPDRVAADVQSPTRPGFPALAIAPNPTSCGQLDLSTGGGLELDARGQPPGAWPKRSASGCDFSQPGRRSATPYEVLLHAAMLGDTTRFTRQDAVEEEWRIVEPLSTLHLRSIPSAKGSWGPAEDRLLAGHGAAGTSLLAGVMSSPFPPIEDYAFLSTATPGRWWPGRGGVALRAAIRLAQRVRRAARPAGRLLSGWRRSASTCARHYEAGTNMPDTWQRAAHRDVHARPAAARTG